jgi:hypothetical protein
MEWTGCLVHDNKVRQEGCENDQESISGNIDVEKFSSMLWVPLAAFGA